MRRVGADLHVAGSRLRGMRRAAVAACCALAALAAAVIPCGRASAAGTASVSISPLSSSVASGTAVTYTLSVTCSVTGGCDGTTVTIPTTTITGDGSTTDFGSWLGNSSCAGVTKTVASGLVTYTYGNIPTGSSNCTFTVTPPNFNTLNGTVATITPTINGSNFTSSAGSPATLTVTASKAASFTKGGPAQVESGHSFLYELLLNCGGAGGVGTSAVTITDVLPSNFTYTSSRTFYSDANGESGTLPGTVIYVSATHTVTYSDPTGATCQSPNVLRPDATVEIQGTASTNGTGNPEGSTIVNDASASWTYLDGTTGSGTGSLTTTVVSPVPTPFLTKQGVTQSIGNAGQYKFPPNGGAYQYTYPGNWNGTGAGVNFRIVMNTNGTGSGVNFAVQDPLPCLDNFSGQVYSSPAPGAGCASPAFIPTVVTAAGFTPTATDVITLDYADGTTGTVAYTPGTGWMIPASPAVAEIDFPPFAEQGSNSSSSMVFNVQGYAAPTVSTTSLLTDTATGNAYLVGSGTPVVPQETAQASVMAVSATEPSGTVFYSSVLANYQGPGTCTESVSPAGSPTQYLNNIEIASTPSAAIYIDYLAPAGATVTSGQSTTFTFAGASGTFHTGTVTATTTPNYNGTGRTLLAWVIPAGALTQAGDYAVVQSPIIVSLGAGCDGTYQNDMTIGYGAPVTACIPGGLAPPLNPPANTGLQSNGSPVAGNYCGSSAPLTIAAINPAFSVDKSVQGNLDASPVTGGGVGNVSPTGGTATYDVTFTNTGEANLTDPVMYDILPAVGDTYSTSLGARGSQFGVLLAAPVSVPAGVTVSYSTAANPCRPEVLPSDPGCVNDWTTTPPSPLSSVTALKFTYTGTVYVSGAGTSTFSIPFTVSAPSGISGQVAWNTIGTTATAGTTAMTPAESSRTGLQAAQSVLGLAKSATPATVSAAGDVISYRFVVTNNASVPLTGVAVTDTQAAPAGPLDGPVSCPGTSLAPGVSMTCTATYTVTQADIDNGSVNDSATASGTPPSGGAVTSAPSKASVTAARAPAVTIVKSAPSAAVHAAGDVIGYEFLVTNTGNVALTSVAVADAQAAPAGPLGGPVTCPGTTLAPGESETCTAAYTVTQADVDHGSVTDTATATGTPPSGPPVTSPPSTLSVPVPAGPAINIVKSATPATVRKVGDVVSYRFTVTDTGNDTLTSVAVTDTQAAPAGPLDGPVTCPGTTLAPGESVTCTAAYTVTQADVDHGSVNDTATASGTPPSGPTVTSPPAGVPVLVAQAPALSVAKSAAPATVHAPGDVISYQFLVTNTGNDTLTSVAVTDVQAAPAGALDGPVTCPGTTLAPGASLTCTASYTVTQADIDHGSVDDTATASGTPPSGPAVSSPPSRASVRVAQAPAIRVVKSASPATAWAGGVIRYRFTVTNAGNVTLTRVTVSDPRLAAAGITVRCPVSRLALGASEVCTASRPYTVTTADAARGTVANTATATAVTPSGRPVRSRPASASVRVMRAIVIPTGEGAGAPAPGASPGLTAAGAAALAAGAVLLLMLLRDRPRRRA